MAMKSEILQIWKMKFYMLEQQTNDNSLYIQIYDCSSLIQVGKYQIQDKGEYLQSKCIVQLGSVYFIVRLNTEERQQYKTNQFILKLPQDQDKLDLDFAILQDKKWIVSYIINENQQVYQPKISLNRIYQQFIQNNNTIIIDNNKILVYDLKTQNNQFFVQLYQQKSKQQTTEYTLTIDNNIFIFQNQQLLFELLSETILSEFNFNKVQNPFYVDETKDNIQTLYNQYGQTLDYQIVNGQLVIGNTRTELNDIQQIYSFINFQNCLILILQRLSNQDNTVCKYNYDDKTITYLYSLPQDLINGVLYYNQSFNEDELDVYIEDIYCTCQVQSEQETQIIQEGNLLFKVNGECSNLSLFQDTSAYIVNYQFIINSNGNMIYQEQLNQEIISILVIHKNIVIVLTEDYIKLYYINKNNDINCYSQQYESRQGQQLVLNQKQIGILDKESKKIYILENTKIQTLYNLLQSITDQLPYEQVLETLIKTENSIPFNASILIPQLELYVTNKDILLQIMRILKVDYNYCSYVINHLRDYDQQLQCINNIIDQWPKYQQYGIIMQIYNKYHNQQFIDSIKHSLALSQPKILTLILKRLQIEDYEIVKYLNNITQQLLQMTTQQEFDISIKSQNDNNKSKILQSLQDIFDIVTQVYNLQAFKNNIKSYKNVMSFHVDRNFVLQPNKYQILISMVLQTNKSQLTVKHIQMTLPQIIQHQQEQETEINQTESQIQQTMALLYDDDDDQDSKQKNKLRKFQIKTVNSSQASSQDNKVNISISTLLTNKTTEIDSSFIEPKVIQQNVLEKLEQNQDQIQQDQEWNDEW